MQYVTQATGMGKGKDHCATEKFAAGRAQVPGRVAQGQESPRIGTSPITTIFLNR